jgi:hypothetical protein
MLPEYIIIASALFALWKEALLSFASSYPSVYRCSLGIIICIKIGIIIKCGVFFDNRKRIFLVSRRTLINKSGIPRLSASGEHEGNYNKQVSFGKHGIKEALN